MAEYFLVLLQPLVDRVPVEREVASQPSRTVDGLLVAPGGVRRRTLATANRPIRGIALQWAVARAKTSLEQVQTHVRLGEIEDGQVPGFVQQLDALAVDDRLAAEHRSNPARVFFEV